MKEYFCYGLRTKLQNDAMLRADLKVVSEKGTHRRTSAPCQQKNRRAPFFTFPLDKVPSGDFGPPASDDVRVAQARCKRPLNT